MGAAFGTYLFIAYVCSYIVKIDSVSVSVIMYETVYLIRPRKLDRRCVNRHQAPNLTSDLREQINISCYTESQALRLH